MQATDRQLAEFEALRGTVVRIVMQPGRGGTAVGTLYRFGFIGQLLYLEVRRDSDRGHDLFVPAKFLQHIEAVQEG